MSEIASPQVVIEPYYDEDFEEQRWRLRCPHCGGLDQFREVEVAIAWCVTEEFVVRDGRIVQVVWERTNGSGDFEHDRYECEHCDKPVSMTIEDVSYRN